MDRTGSPRDGGMSVRPVSPRTLRYAATETSGRRVPRDHPATSRSTGGGDVSAVASPRGLLSPATESRSSPAEGRQLYEMKGTGHQEDATHMQLSLRVEQLSMLLERKEMEVSQALELLHQARLSAADVQAAASHKVAQLTEDFQRIIQHERSSRVGEGEAATARLAHAQRETRVAVQALEADVRLYQGVAAASELQLAEGHHAKMSLDHTTPHAHSEGRMEVHLLRERLAALAADNASLQAHMALLTASSAEVVSGRDAAFAQEVERLRQETLSLAAQAASDQVAVLSAQAQVREVRARADADMRTVQVRHAEVLRAQDADHQLECNAVRAQLGAALHSSNAQLVEVESQRVVEHAAFNEAVGALRAETDTRQRVADSRSDDVMRTAAFTVRTTVEELERKLARQHVECELSIEVLQAEMRRKDAAADANLSALAKKYETAIAVLQRQHEVAMGALEGKYVSLATASDAAISQTLDVAMVEREASYRHELELTVAKHKRDLSDMTADNARLTAQLAAVTAAHASLTSEHAAKLSQTREECEFLLQRKDEELLGVLAHQGRTAEKLAAQADLQARHDADMSALRSATADAATALERKHVEVVTDLQRNLTRVSLLASEWQGRYNAALAERGEEVEEAVHAANGAHFRALQTSQALHSAALEELSAAGRVREVRAREAAERRGAALKADHATAVSELNSRLSDALAQAGVAQERATQQVAAMKEVFTATAAAGGSGGVVRGVTQEQPKDALALAFIGEMKAGFAARERELKELHESQLAALQHRCTADVAAVQSKTDAMHAVAANSVSATEVRVRADAEDTILALRSRVSAVEVELRASFSGEVSLLQSQLAACQGELAEQKRHYLAMQSSHSSGSDHVIGQLQQAHTATMERMEELHRRGLEAATLSADARVAELAAQHAAKEEAWRATFQTEALRAASEVSALKTIIAQSAHTASDLTALQTQHDVALRRLRTQHADDSAAIRAAFERTLAANKEQAAASQVKLGADHAAALHKADAAHAIKVTLLQRQIVELTAAWSTRTALPTARTLLTTHALAGSGGALKRAGRSTEVGASDGAAAVLLDPAVFESSLFELQQRHEQVVASLTDAHMRDLNEVRGDAAARITQLGATLERLRAAVGDGPQVVSAVQELTRQAIECDKSATAAHLEVATQAGEHAALVAQNAFAMAQLQEHSMCTLSAQAAAHRQQVQSLLEEQARLIHLAADATATTPSTSMSTSAHAATSPVRGGYTTSLPPSQSLPMAPNIRTVELAYEGACEKAVQVAASRVAEHQASVEVQVQESTALLRSCKDYLAALGDKRGEGAPQPILVRLVSERFQSTQLELSRLVAVHQLHIQNLTASYLAREQHSHAEHRARVAALNAMLTANTLAAPTPTPKSASPGSSSKERMYAHASHTLALVGTTSSADATAELAATKERHTRALTALSAKHTAELSDGDSARLAIRHELNTSLRERDEWQEGRVRAEMAKMRESADAALRSLQQQLDAAKASHAAEVATVRAEHLAALQALDTARMTTAAASRKGHEEAVEALVSAHTTKVASLRELMSAAHSKYKEEAATREVSLLGPLQTLTETLQKRLTDVIRSEAHTAAQNADLASESADLAKQASSLQGERMQLQASVTALRGELQRSGVAYEDMTARARSTVFELSKQLELEHKRVAILTSQLEVRVNSSIKDNKAAVADASHYASVREHNVEQLKSATQQVQAELVTARLELRGSNVTVAELGARLQASEMRCATLEAEVLRYREKVSWRGAHSPTSTGTGGAGTHATDTGTGATDAATPTSSSIGGVATPGASAARVNTTVLPSSPTPAVNGSTTTLAAAGSPNATDGTKGAYAMHASTLFQEFSPPAATGSFARSTSELRTSPHAQARAGVGPFSLHGLETVLLMASPPGTERSVRTVATVASGNSPFGSSLGQRAFSTIRERAKSYQLTTTAASGGVRAGSPTKFVSSPMRATQLK